MFTRYGGCGEPPFDSLNLSYHVGDNDRNIPINRSRICDELGIHSLSSAHQVHGDDIVAVYSTPIGNQEFQGYDALVTDRPGIGLLVQQADCQAILLFAPRSRAIAAIHCGWKGSVGNIIPKTIARMEQEYGADPAHMIAVISPSLGPCCAEFKHFNNELPDWMYPFQVRRNYFDFWAISRLQLRDAGVRSACIDTATICTRCDTRFFSYRRSAKKGMKTTGRNGSVIALPVR